MKKIFAMLLAVALLLCGCTGTAPDREMETVYVLTREVQTYWIMMGAGQRKESSDIILYRYDRNGDLLERREYHEGDMTRRTKYVRDDEGRETEQRSYDYTNFFPELTWTATTYDEAGRVLRYTDYACVRETGWVEHTYDEQGRMAKAEYSSGAVTQYTYDETGLVITTYDSGFDPAGDTNTTVRTYDENGNMLSLYYYENDALKSYSQWEYDDQGRVLRSTTQDSEGEETSVWEYEYDEKTGRETVKLPNGNVHEHEYDEHGNQISQEIWNEDGELTYRCERTYRAISVPVS